METPIGSLKTPTDDKDNQTQPVFLSVDEACPEPQSEDTGHVLVDGRKRLGVTREEAASASNILISYLEMLESGNYKEVSDPLYLLPFLQRYAGYLAIDVSEVTWRFMREFHARENAALEISKPSASLVADLPRQLHFNSRFLIAAAILFGAISAAILYRAHYAHTAGSRLASAKPQPSASPTVGSKLPTVVTTALQVPSPLPSPMPSPLAPPVAAITSQARTTMRVQKRHRATRHRQHHHLQRSAD